jgi:hypothetical protein
MAFDLHRGTTLLFTTRNAAGALGGQLWEWSGTSWFPIGTLPGVRTSPSMAYDEARRKMAIVGGANFFSLSDVWEWRYVDPASCRTP